MFPIFNSILELMGAISGSWIITIAEHINTIKGFDISLIILGVIFMIIIALELVVYERNGEKSEDKVKYMEYSDSTGDKDLDKLIKKAGYAYDAKQDIFYSRINPWQRKCGYCKLYDESAAPLGMIIDCEPVYFDYKGEKWLIEFWKGQYDLTVGGEIGVYKEIKSNIEIQNIFFGDFYEAVSDNEFLEMAYELKYMDQIILTRAAKHWWLTGFKLGTFFNPSDLSMNLEIKFNDEDMKNAFIKGLKNSGYLEQEIKISGNIVGICFEKPHTEQPYSRNKVTDKITQEKNKLLCDEYQQLTKPYDNLKDKLYAVKSASPRLYNEIMNIGKTKVLFEKYKIISRHLK